MGLAYCKLLSTQSGVHKAHKSVHNGVYQHSDILKLAKDTSHMACRSTVKSYQLHQETVCMHTIVTHSNTTPSSCNSNLKCNHSTSVNVKHFSPCKLSIEVLCKKTNNRVLLNRVPNTMVTNIWKIKMAMVRLLTMPSSICRNARSRLAAFTAFRSVLGQPNWPTDFRFFRERALHTFGQRKTSLKKPHIFSILGLPIELQFFSFPVIF